MKIPEVFLSKGRPTLSGSSTQPRDATTAHHAANPLTPINNECILTAAFSFPMESVLSLYTSD